MNLFTLLTKQEGYRQFPYRDTRGKLTIGIGRNLDAEGVTLPEAQGLLASDCDRIVKKLQVLPFWNEIGEVRQGVLISVALNCGVDGMLEFHDTLADIAHHMYAIAAGDLMSSAAARELPNRYRVLAAMLSTGQWPIE